VLSKLSEKTRSHADTLVELVGLAGVAVAVAQLFGFWWGVLLGSVLLVLFAQTIRPTSTNPAEGDE